MFELVCFKLVQPLWFNRIRLYFTVYALSIVSQKIINFQFITTAVFPAVTIFSWFIQTKTFLTRFLSELSGSSRFFIVDGENLAGDILTSTGVYGASKTSFFGFESLLLQLPFCFKGVLSPHITSLLFFASFLMKIRVCVFKIKASKNQSSNKTIVTVQHQKLGIVTKFVYSIVSWLNSSKWCNAPKNMVKPKTWTFSMSLSIVVKRAKREEI